MNIYVDASEQASVENNLAFLHTKSAISQYFVGTSDTVSVQMTMLAGSHVPTNFQMYQQNSEKSLLGAVAAPAHPPPPPAYASGWVRIRERFLLSRGGLHGGGIVVEKDKEEEK